MLALNTDITDLFSPPPENISSKPKQHSCSDSSSLKPTAPSEVSSSIIGESLDSVLTQLQCLNVKVDKFEQQQSKPNFVINTAYLSTLVNDNNVVTMSISRYDHVVFPIFTVNENSCEQGLFCTACESTLKYDFNNGLSFGPEEPMPSSFSHLKDSVKRHNQNMTHKRNVETKERISKQNDKILKNSKEASIKCASVAYLGYKFGLTNNFYEYCVSEIFTLGWSLIPFKRIQ